MGKMPERAALIRIVDRGVLITTPRNGLQLTPTFDEAIRSVMNYLETGVDEPVGEPAAVADQLCPGLAMRIERVQNGCIIERFEYRIGSAGCACSQGRSVYDQEMDIDWIIKDILEQT